MVRIAGRGWRVALRHLIEIATGALVMGCVLLIVIQLRPVDPLLGIGVAVGFPVVGHTIGALIGTALRGDWFDPPKVSWDQQGLTAGNRPADYLSWCDFQGYRFTWEYPTRLKILRRSGRALKIDLFAFNSSDRELLVAELDGRSGALPNTRLKLSAPS